jgi:hypothetical protein
VLGKYIISDQPMSPEQWARERADLIEESPLPQRAIDDTTKR